MANKSNENLTSPILFKKCDKVRQQNRNKKLTLQTFLIKCDKVRQQTRNRVSKHRQQKKTLGTSDQSPVYPNGSSLRKAVSRAKQALPKSLDKRKAVVKEMYEKYFDAPKVSRPVKRSSGLDDNVKNAVISFYERSDISQQAPGRKDFVNIKDKSGKKTKVQKKYLMLPIDQAYDKFCEETGSVPLKLSKFFELRPKHVISASKTPHNICLCIYHSNFNYAINAFNKIVPEMPKHCDRDNFYETFFCEPMTEDCYFGECKSCKGVFADTILGVASFSKDVKVKWQAWKKVDNRWQNKQQIRTLETLGNYIVDLAPHFYKHHYINHEQLKSYQRSVSAVKSDKSAAVVQIDFAENYKCEFQDEATNAHWNQSQVSLFTAAIWTCDEMNSYSVVTDDPDHSKRTIVPFVDRLFEELPKGIKTVHIWSDGPTSQFKNKFIASALSVLELKHKMKIYWSFFAASHGKGPTDGTGGALKHQVWTAVKSREAIVCNALDFTEAVNIKSKVKPVVIKIKNENPANLKTVIEALESVLKNPSSIFVTMKAIDFIDKGFEIYCNETGFAARSACAEMRRIKALKSANDDKTILRYRWFDKLNDTIQGRFTVSRGSKNISDIGRVIAVNGERNLKILNRGHQCHQINKTDETIGSVQFFPPLQKKHDLIWTYSDGGCKSFSLLYEYMQSVRGIKTAYKGLNPADKSMNPECECSSFIGCFLPGTTDMHPCLGVFILGSLPHFFKADPSIFKAIEGMNPKEHLHKAGIYVDLLAGVPVLSYERWQISFLVQPVPEYQIFSSIAGDTWIPVLWFEESFSILKMDLVLIISSKISKMIGILTGHILMAVGVMGLITLLAIRFQKRPLDIPEVVVTTPQVVMK